MNSQAQCYEALLAGKILVCKDDRTRLALQLGKVMRYTLKGWVEAPGVTFSNYTMFEQAKDEKVTITLQDLTSAWNNNSASKDKSQDAFVGLASKLGFKLTCNNSGM